MKSKLHTAEVVQGYMQMFKCTCTCKPMVRMYTCTLYTDYMTTVTLSKGYFQDNKHKVENQNQNHKWHAAAGRAGGREQRLVNDHTCTCTIIRLQKDGSLYDGAMLLHISHKHHILPRPRNIKKYAEAWWEKRMWGSGNPCLN